MENVIIYGVTHIVLLSRSILVYNNLQYQKLWNTDMNNKFLIIFSKLLLIFVFHVSWYYQLLQTRFSRRIFNHFTNNVPSYLKLRLKRVNIFRYLTISPKLEKLLKKTEHTIIKDRSTVETVARMSSQPEHSARRKEGATAVCTFSQKKNGA